MNILKSGETVAEKRCKNESVLVNPRKENGKKKMTDNSTSIACPAPEAC